MQQHHYTQCEKCDGITLHVSGPAYTMPHTQHLLAIIALAVAVHPFAGVAWAGVYAIHAIGNIGKNPLAHWLCTYCGTVRRL